MKIISYPRTLGYLKVRRRFDGSRYETLVDSVYELGRPPMGEIFSRLEKDSSVAAITEDQLSSTEAAIDSPAGMLRPDRYRELPVLMINNNGSLPRCHLEEYVYRAGSRWVWHNHFDVELFRRFFSEPFHPCAVYQPWFSQDTPPSPKWKEPFELPGGPILAYCGRLDPEKRIELLFYLLDIVRRSTDVALVLTGTFNASPSGVEYRRKLQALVESLGLEEHVHLVGHIDRESLWALQHRASLMVNFTVNHDEAFGQAQAEALSVGTPVVGAAWGGLKEVVTKDCGFLADTLVSDHGTYVDILSAAAFTVEFLSDPQRQDYMAEAARKRGASFQWSSFLQGLEQKLAGPPGPSLPPIPPSRQVNAVVEQVLSPALQERIKPFLNERAMESTIDDIHSIRNQDRLGKEEWFRFALIDPPRHQAFVREHYLFLYEAYGTETPERASSRLTETSRLHPLRPSLQVIANTASVDDLVFGSQIFELDDHAAALLLACTSRPTATFRQLTRSCQISQADAVEAATTLIGHGLILPTRGDT